MKKGFTLIELLAVILVLGIIALIAVPNINNILASSSESADELNCREFIKSGEVLLDKSILDDEELENDTGYYVSELVDIMKEKGVLPKGTIPEDGYVYVKYDKILYAEFLINGNLVICEEGNCKLQVMEEDDELEADEYVSLINSCTSPYKDDVVVYFNPETGTKCTESEYNINLKNYDSSMNSTGLKNGCMRWYAYDYDDSTNTVSLLLDHNTTAKAFSLLDYSYKYEYPDSEHRDTINMYTYSEDKDINYVLRNDTSTWLGVPSVNMTIIDSYISHYLKTNQSYYGYSYINSENNYKYIESHADFLTVQEIEKIIGRSINNDQSYLDSCFEEMSYTDKFREYRTITTSPLHYLYDNTACENYGCEIVDNEIFGYYIKDNNEEYQGQNFSYITLNGKLISYSYGSSNGRFAGIRPTIKINANVIDFVKPQTW